MVSHTRLQRGMAFLFSLLAASAPAFGQVTSPPPASKVAPADRATAPKPSQKPAMGSLSGTAPEARIAELTREFSQARYVGDRAVVIRALEQLVELTKGTPAWGEWLLLLANSEFFYEGQSRAIELGETLVASPEINPEVRSRAASRLAWFYLSAGETAKGTRAYASAESAFSAAASTAGAAIRDDLEAHLLTARSHLEFRRGQLDRSTRTSRTALSLARRYTEAVLADSGNDKTSHAYQSAVRFAETHVAAVLMYNLLREARSSEALIVAQEGLARAQLERLGPDATGGWQQRLASVYLDRRQFDGALEAARVSLDDIESAGGSDTGMLMSVSRREEVRALIGLQRWAEADAIMSAHLEFTRGDPIAYQRVGNPLLEALLAAKNGRIDFATTRVEGATRTRARIYGPKYPLAVESRGIRGAISLMNGSVLSALSDYEDLFSVLLDTASGWIDLAPTGARGYYLDIAFDEFLRFVAETYRKEGPTAVEPRLFARMVQVTDRLGSAAIQQSIVDSAARVRAASPELSELLGHEQEIRRTVQDIYREIADLVGENLKEVPEERRVKILARLKQLRTSAEKAQQQLADARKAIADRFPAYSDLVTPVSPKPEVLRKALAEGEVFLTILPTRLGTFVWAVNSNGQQALHVSTWTEQDIEQRVAALRRSLDVGSLLPAGISRFDFAPFHEVYRELLAPMAAGLKGAHTLVVAAHGSLAAIPLGTLLMSPSADLQSAAWLIREFSVTQVPGASAFVAQRRARSKAVATAPLRGYADPDFSAAGIGNANGARTLLVGELARRAATYSAERGFRYASIPALPETRDEVHAIAKALGADASRDLIVGSEATRQRVLSDDLANQRVIAFATHGLLPGEIPGLSKPALAMANTGDPEQSPLLDLDDILTLKLNADWVVLSACNTAGAERGGSAMSGLVRGIFFAGGRSVLATHWAVESNASTALVSEVFSAYAQDMKRGRAAGLREAQLAMIQGKIGSGKYAHPFFWAPYALFGDPIR